MLFTHTSEAVLQVSSLIEVPEDLRKKYMSISALGRPECVTLVLRMFIEHLLYSYTVTGGGPVGKQAHFPRVFIKLRDLLVPRKLSLGILWRVSCIKYSMQQKIIFKKYS